MATVYTPIDIASHRPRSSTFPATVKANGSNYPVLGLAFDAAADEATFFSFPIQGYGSGNLTLEIQWYADTASSGDVVFGAAIAAITPNSDTQDIETDGLATENTATDTHLGTTNQRLHSVSITISNLDSLATGDYLTIRLRRVGSNGSDTMSGDAIVVGLMLSFSDT